MPNVFLFLPSDPASSTPSKGHSLVPKGNKDGIAIVAYDYGVQAPRDAGTGQATGKRIYKPITITKEIDKTSPLLLNALVNKRVLSEVVIEETEGPPPNPPRVTRRFTLRDAVITAVKPHLGPALSAGRMLQEFTITYGAIKGEP